MCVLHVTSETTSFVSFLSDTGFPTYMSHEKGEISSIGKRQPFDEYGFSAIVSEKEWDDLAGQIEDALNFLVQHEESLQKLISLYDVKDIRFDFPYSCRLDDQTFMQCDYLPPEFLKLAGSLGIGIELSHYHPSNDEDENGQSLSTNARTLRG